MKPLCNGDGHEGERLYDLGVGHVLTAQDVKDIENLLADYNDEIGSSADAYNRAREQVLHEIGGEELVKAAGTADDWAANVSIIRAMEHYYRKAREYGTKAKAAPSA